MGRMSPEKTVTPTLNEVWGLCDYTCDVYYRIQDVDNEVEILKDFDPDRDKEIGKKEVFSINSEIVEGKLALVCNL